MAAASLACWAIVTAIMGAESRAAALLGAAGPFVAAAGTWFIVERLHARAPDRVSGVMIKLFAAKLVLFGAYVAAVVLLLSAGTRAFIVSFTSQYIMLHFMEAVYLRRLFAGADRTAGAD